MACTFSIAWHCSIAGKNRTEQDILWAAAKRKSQCPPWAPSVFLSKGTVLPQILGTIIIIDFKFMKLAIVK
jgi:hypothetical protein